MRLSYVGCTLIGHHGGTLETRVPPGADASLPVVQIIQECEKNGGFQTVDVLSSDGETIYQVVLPPWDRTEIEVVCECPSYLHRGRCRHQREALTRVCNWSELDGMPQSAEQSAKHVCPECGGRTQTVVIGD